MFEVKNPIVEGYYADPEARFYEGKYWIYVTRSHSEYKEQLNLDAFSSSDLIHWEKHEGIIAMEDFPWIEKAVWAPTIIEKEGQYYLIFASNDIQNNSETGGLEIAVSDDPAGPFKTLTGKILINRFINGAQPIDAHLFKDDDGTIYLYYGGWQHCNAAIMNENMDGFIPQEDGKIFKEITPKDYVEGPCMIKKDNLYYFMWSEGNWVNGTYHVCYSVSENPMGPFDNSTTILEAQPPIAEGPGHHGYLQIKGTDEWLIVYHRRKIGDLEPGNRVLCIDKMKFEHGKIEPVEMTNEW